MSFQLRKIQKFTWASSRGFLCVSCKLLQITLATKIFWEEVDLVRFIKDVWLMVV
jgi:hypothetical protein